MKRMTIIVVWAIFTSIVAINSDRRNLKFKNAMIFLTAATALSKCVSHVYEHSGGQWWLPQPDSKNRRLEKPSLWLIKPEADMRKPVSRLYGMVAVKRWPPLKPMTTAMTPQKRGWHADSILEVNIDRHNLKFKEAMVCVIAPIAHRYADTWTRVSLFYALLTIQGDRRSRNKNFATAESSLKG